MNSTGTTQSGKAISKLYFENGCVVNAHGVPDVPSNPDQINEAPVFDAMRRWSQFFRVIARSQFIGYAVENDKSILWFKRLDAYTRQDLWQGIADDIEETGRNGQLSNRWLLDFDLIPFSPSQSSTWKPEAFADYWGLYERCLGFSADIGGDAAMLWHGALGQKASGENLMSEYPTGYRYANLDNPTYGNPYANSGASSDFYKSCRIYEPALEIESAETVLENDEYVVKVTLNGRLWNTEGETGGAPSSIDRDTSGWTAATIAAEPFRTPENGLRLYLLNQSISYNPTAIAGDRAYNTSRATNNPYAAIYPRFFLTRLVPEPRTDDNSDQDDHDTPLWSDAVAYAELVLRAICEGWVDDVKTAEEVCTYYEDNGDTMPASWKHTCYTWENLCYQAFGGRWVTLTPSEVTSWTHDGQVRSEMPQGFGPIPNQRATAECFNQLSKIVNLLTKVRVMLPYHLEENHNYFQDDVSVGATVTSCGGDNIYYTKPPGAVTSTGSTGWSDATGSIAATREGSIFFSAPNYYVRGYLDQLEWRFSATDANAVNAIPDTWSDMLDTNLGGIFHRTTTIWLIPVTDPGGGSCSIGAEYAEDQTEECLFLSPNDSATILPPALPAGWLTDTGSAGTNTDVLLVPLSLTQEPILVVPLVDVTRT